MYSILIVDDEKAIRRALSDVLELEGYDVYEASDGRDALEKVSNQMFDLIFCDIKMPNVDGLEFIKQSKELTNAPIIMISGHGTIETAVKAMKDGAADYIEKPFDLSKILAVTKEYINKNKTPIPTSQGTIRRKPKVSTPQQTVIIGQSKPIKQMMSMIDRVAPTDAKVLITGDNGTGKELVARMIHEKSLRSQAPFIELNCAAIPNELIESELFGHEKGSFTSAIAKQKGKFQLADNGTLFLDEIGDMSAGTQSKVLQAIQEKKILPVGSEKEITVDVRILSATNKDLKQEIKANRFREDLYHRINVVEIKVPSLNERRDDIPLLIDYFLNTIAKESKTPKLQIEPKAIKLLTDFDYTGNVRQLRNMIERLCIFADNVITASDVKEYI